MNKIISLVILLGSILGILFVYKDPFFSSQFKTTVYAIALIIGIVCVLVWLAPLVKKMAQKSQTTPFVDLGE